MIVTRNLTRLFKTRRGQHILAVDHIDFEVVKKDIFGFLGPNGAGKTTTIHMLTTVLEPTEGTATIGGFDILTNPMEAKRRLGIMPELPMFYENMRAVDQLKFYGEFYGYTGVEATSRARELISLVGLDRFAVEKIKTFSHGMRKRLALAQSLMNDPDILILDEPMGGLDPMGVRSFREMIKDLNRSGITIFLSSHLLSEVQQLCNRVGIINNGKILAVDTIGKLSSHIKMGQYMKIYFEAYGVTPEVQEWLKKYPGIREVNPSSEPGGFYLIIDEQNDEKGYASGLNSALAGKNIFVSRLEISMPSLEDMFMSITKEG
jgi:ABC-2 type transport system ATP-binding protein